MLAIQGTSVERRQNSFVIVIPNCLSEFRGDSNSGEAHQNREFAELNGILKPSI